MPRNHGRSFIAAAATHVEARHFLQRLLPRTSVHRLTQVPSGMPRLYSPSTFLAFAYIPRNP